MDFSVLGVSVQMSLTAAVGAMIVLAGLVGTARLVLKAHVSADVWQGYAVGIVSVWVAKGFIL